MPRLYERLQYNDRQREVRVNERTTIWLGAVAGAVAGGVAAYLLFTERGRRLRATLEPRIKDLANEVARARSAAADARSAFDDVAVHARRGR